MSKGRIPCHLIWEDDLHFAFLSIYPFDLPPVRLQELILASQRVARLVDATFDDVGRTALVLEGFGVDHVHAKLYPLHGTRVPQWKPIRSSLRQYFDQYQGYVSSHDGDRASDKVLSALAERIRRQLDRVS